MNELHRKTKKELIAEVARRQKRVDQYHQRQMFLKSIIHGLVDIMVVTIDHNYSITYYNKYFLDHLKEKYKHDVIPQIGDSLWDYTIDSELGKSFADRVLAGERFVIEFIRPKSDKNQYYQGRYCPIYNEKGEIIGGTSFTYNFTARKEAEIALTKKHEELIESAYRAGMADIASEVMYNVENALENIIMISKTILELLGESPIILLGKINALLQSKMGNINDFLLHDSRGTKILNSYLEVGELLKTENTIFKRKLTKLLGEVDIIKGIVVAQQKYALLADSFEEIALNEIMDHTLEIQKDLLTRHSIKFIKHLNTVPKITGNKTKMVYVFANIIKNAQEAMTNVPGTNRKFIIEIKKSMNEIVCKFVDNGEGISEEHLQNIFNHGYSTKKGKAGFGLHCCANYITQMKGRIYAQSKGKNSGATIWVTFPLHNRTSSRDDAPDKQPEFQPV